MVEWHKVLEAVDFSMAWQCLLQSRFFVESIAALLFMSILELIGL